MRDRREDAVAAVRILNYFVGDLVGACHVHDVFELLGSKIDRRHAKSLKVIYRISLSYLFLTLDKWSQFYDRFSAIIPSDCKAECKRLHNEIRRRRIRRFRNVFVGHIWDKKIDRALTEREVQEAADLITEGDEAKFRA